MFFRIFSLLFVFVVFFLKTSFAVANANSAFFFERNNFMIFDIDEYISDERDLPQVDTSTKKLSGKFFLEKIGWQRLDGIKIDCDIAHLDQVSSCPFTGHITDEIIGDISFETSETCQGVTFDPKTLKLSGEICSYAGNFPMDNIILGLGNENIKASFENLEVRHNHMFLFPNIAQLKVEYIDAPNNSTLYTSTKKGRFTNIDLSKSGNYRITITSHENTESVHDVFVSPGKASTKYTYGNLITQVCNNHLHGCPEDGKLHATIMQQQSAPRQTYADGQDTLSFVLKLRDTYGNYIPSGKTIKIAYENTVKQDQTNPNSPSAIINPQLTENTLTLTSKDTEDLSISFASFAPTNEENQFILKSISVDDYILERNNGLGADHLMFLPPISVFIQPKSNSEDFRIIENENNTFSIVETNNIPEFTPQNIQYSFSLQPKKIGGIVYHRSCILPGCAHTNFTANPGETDIFTYFSVSENTQTPPENMYVRSYVQYNIGYKDIKYRSQDESMETLTQDSKNIKIIGHAGFGVSQEQSSTINAYIRMNFFNMIRKNTSYIIRNALVSENATVLAETGKTLELSAKNKDSWNKKRTIVAVGQDIVIKDTINTKSKKPIAIIALSESGKGGHIIIDGNVTEIYASLIADRGIKGQGVKNKQLYIFGSIISSNTYASGVCPYFIQKHCDQWVFPQIRSQYTKKNALTYHPTARQYPDSSIIVEYNPAITADPPPGLHMQNIR